MPEFDDVVSEPIRIKSGLSTRPVQIAGQNHRTSFALELLHDIVSQVRNGFLPLGTEHLDYLPPIGRIYDGEVVQASDGEWELNLLGRELPRFTPRGVDPPNLLEFVQALPFADGPVTTEVSLSVEGRNYEAAIFERMRHSAPLPLKEENRWAALPPLIFVLTFPVLWGAAKFAGAFCAELGKEAAQGLIRWMKDSADEAIDADRDRLVTVTFEIEPGQSVYGFIPFRFDDSDAELFVQRAIDELAVLASFAGAQKDAKVDGPMRIAFIFDGASWQQGWWSDGESVVVTHWFKENCPDPSRFLGHPILEVPPSDEALDDD